MHAEDSILNSISNALVRKRDFCTTRTATLAILHQCPKCRKAWKMEKFEEGQWLEGGLYIPPGRRAVSIPTIL